MHETPKNTPNHLNGSRKITLEAIKGITNIVEAIHYKILNIGGFYDKSQSGKTKGITGAVYRNIERITDLSGIGTEKLIAQLVKLTGRKTPNANQQAVISAINGVLGDYLAHTHNELAIGMQWRQNGKPIDYKKHAAELKHGSKKLLIVIHGLCMNDLQWTRNQHNHAQKLAAELDVIPLFLYYNTGQHISENGKLLAQLLQQLNTKIPLATTIYILTHSMGGLVARSACFYGKKSFWIKKVKKIVFLGVPHHGSPLEKAGNIIDLALDSNSFSAPLSRLGKIRSSGITDLRYGNILDTDWNTSNRFDAGGDNRTAVPLLKNISYLSVAACKSAEPNAALDNTIGDGLVPLKSAMGSHSKSGFSLAFRPENQHIIRGIGHLDLLNNLDAYAQIKTFFA